MLDFGRKFLRGLLPFYAKAFRNSEDYWLRRYRFGGHSGAGSRGAEAEFKAAFVNTLCQELQLDTLAELGCGDGQNAQLLRVGRYLGLDISPRALSLAAGRCRDRAGFDFALIRGLDTSGVRGRVAERLGELPSLTLSMDVIFHLVEDEVFRRYLDTLFASSRKYVAIYSTDHDETGAAHVRHRHFTPQIESLYPVRLLRQAAGFDRKTFFVYEKTDG
mgnify:CR=1 FL=1